MIDVIKNLSVSDWINVALIVTLAINIVLIVTH